jgi:hypothetical protein
MFEESSGPGTPVADGSPIGWLEDLSANAYHLIQTTTANKPTLDANNASFGGAVVWDFSGNDFWQKDFATSYTQPNTIIGVFRVSDLTSARYIIDGNDSINRNVFFTTADAYTFFSGSSVGGGTPDTDTHVFVATNGSLSKVWLDGTLIINTNAGSHSINGVTSGARYTGDGGVIGKIAELCIINRAITTAEHNAMLAWFKDTYGINYEVVA